MLPTTLCPACMSNTRADHPREAANLANVSPQTYHKGATHSPDSPLPSLWDVHFRRPCSDRCCTCRKSPLSGLPAGQPNRASEPSVWAILRPCSGCGCTCRKIALERPPRRPAEKGLRNLSLGHSEAVFRLRLHLPENRSGTASPQGSGKGHRGGVGPWGARSHYKTTVRLTLLLYTKASGLDFSLYNPCNIASFGSA